MTAKAAAATAYFVNLDINIFRKINIKEKK